MTIIQIRLAVFTDAYASRAVPQPPEHLRSRLLRRYLPHVAQKQPLVLLLIFRLGLTQFRLECRDDFRHSNHLLPVDSEPLMDFFPRNHVLEGFWSR